jgi:tetracycline repressor-like protein
MDESPSRASIIEASRELMLKRSYAATSVDEICSKAGVSKGSFYHFFESKEDLINRSDLWRRRPHRMLRPRMFRVRARRVGRARTTNPRLELSVAPVARFYNDTAV